jgi:hypothetical protein
MTPAQMRTIRENSIRAADALYPTLLRAMYLNEARGVVELSEVAMRALDRARREINEGMGN